jgi:hypothetical protein
MDDFPSAALRAKHAGHPQCPGSRLHLAANFGFEAFDLDEVGQLVGDVGGECLETGGPALSVVCRGAFHRLFDRVPSDRDRTERVGKGGIFAMGIQSLRRVGIASEELVECIVVIA